MSLKRHLFPFAAAFVMIADIPPGPRPTPNPDPSAPPPSSPGCFRRKATQTAAVPMIVLPKPVTA